MARLIGSIVLISVCISNAYAQETSLWSYTGNVGGDKGFQIRELAITTDASRAVTFAQQFGTNTPQKPKFAVWDFASGKQISAWRGEAMSVGVALSHDGTKVASLGLSATDDGPTIVDVWQVEGGELLMQAEVQPRTDARRATIRFSPDDNSLFLFGGIMQLLEISSGKVAPVGGKRTLPAEDLDWSEPADRLAWLNSGMLSIYSPAEDLARDRQPKQTIDMPHQATDARLSGDGQTAFVSLMPNDGARAGHQFLGVWNAATGKQVQLYDCQWGEDEFLRSLHVSHDGQFTAGTRGRSDLLWIYDLKKNVAPDFPRERMAPLGFTPGGVLIVRMPDRPLRYLDPTNFKIIQPPLSDAQRRGGDSDVVEEPPADQPDPQPPQPLFRTWTSSDGKYSVEAVLVRSENGLAHLKKRDGKIVQVPLTKLSPGDRAFVIESNRRN